MKKRILIILFGFILFGGFTSASCDPLFTCPNGLSGDYIVDWQPPPPSCCDAPSGTQTGYNCLGEACSTRTVECVGATPYNFIVRWEPSESSCCEGGTLTQTGYNCGGNIISTRTVDCTGSCSTCTPSCSGKVCGDDGCGGSCGSCSSGYTCSSGSCAVVYGDGIITADEECDDGNLINGDGCSSTGTVESGWSCSGTPSVCEIDCQFIFANWSVAETIEGTNVNLNVLTNEYCDGQEILFEVFENELVGRDAASVNPSNVFVNGNSATGSWIAEWIDDGVGQGNPEYVFKVSLISNSGIYLDNSGELSVVTGNLCSNKTVCSDYLSSTECVSDYCDVADGNVEANNLGLTCGEGGVSCQCEWVSDSCEASYSTFLDGVNIGKCSYTEGGDDNCDDGLLVYSWTANWNWGHDGWVDFNDGPSTNVGDYYSSDGVYYYDPSNQFEGCSEGDTVIECPANVALPFFEFWQIIIVLGIISGIYFFRNKNLKKKSKKKKN